VKKRNLFALETEKSCCTPSMPNDGFASLVPKFRIKELAFDYTLFIGSGFQISARDGDKKPLVLNCPFFSFVTHRL
jgi:hypothetical protein